MSKKIEVAELEALIKAEYYTRIPDSTTTLCSLELHSGYQVVGKSACIDPADFNDVIGRELAYKDAFNQLWALEGYARMSKELDVPKTAKGRVELEKRELAEKTTSLSALLRSGQPSIISDRQWELMHEQRKHMVGYFTVLESRLDTWED